MKPHLTIGQSFALYGIVLAFVFLFFLLGLTIGHNASEELHPQAEAVKLPTAPVPDVQSDLDFYQRIMAPAKGEEEPAPPKATPPAKPPEMVIESDPVDAPAVSPPAKAKANRDSGPITYTIQVGALATEQDARALLTRLEGRGFSGILKRPQAGGDQYFRVWVGEFRTSEDAEVTAKRLKAQGFLTYVRTADLEP